MSSFSMVLIVLLIAGIAPVLIIFIGRGVRRLAIAGSGIPSYLGWAVPVALTLWFFLANIGGYMLGQTSNGLITPAGLSLIFIPMTAAILVVFAARPVTRLLERMPPDRLIGVQVYRAAGALFVYLYLHDHFVSRGFALSAGAGDMIVGISAPFVARLARNKGRGYIFVSILWNVFGLADLIAAPLAAIFFGPQGISTFPLIVVPLFLGPPLGTVLHLASLRNLYLLNRNAAATADRRSSRPREFIKGQ